ncbi:MAG TPA: hypothetical protein VIT68_05355, partial [Candidatus Gracilibacteria bacterium]
MNTQIKVNSEIRRIEAPFVFTIFGASGDLAKLKIFPSLFELAEQRRFRSDFAIIGYSRSSITEEAFREEFAQAVRKAFEGSWDDRREGVLAEILSHVWYFQGAYDNSESFQNYAKFRDEIMAGSQKVPDKTPLQEVFYFSVPPTVFEPIIEHLKIIEDDRTAMR